MMHDDRGKRHIRITLVIDDDVLRAARDRDYREAGCGRSSLARRAVVENSKAMTRNGFPLLKVQKGAPQVTSELVKQLGEEPPLPVSP